MQKIKTVFVLIFLFLFVSIGKSQILNTSSSNFHIESTAETDKVTIDTPSGFFNAPFTATINTEKNGETLIYTLDGSDPRSSSHILTGTSPVSVLIDPNSTLGNRGKTGGVILRATQTKEGYASSNPETRTYLFTSYVVTQSAPGGNWPTSNVNGQIIDLEMDSKIYNDSRYKNLMESSLLDIPTISISIAPENLFGSDSGIYVNARYHGKEWERPANVELINPDGSAGFNIDAGIRIRGGWSRHNGYPKHAFRLFFRSEYGNSKLKYPLFENEGVDEFDKVDLRCSQNYSWANGGDISKHNTMNRDVFSRDTQRDMNQPYTRSRYYHLYLNGLYWGVYQTQERAEANFAESYFGGDKDDYDVIKVDIGENWNLYEIEATDGNTNAWEEIWKMCEQGFESNEKYFNLLGLNSEGKTDTSLNVWLDIENFIDYMLTIFYTGNLDAPVSKFSNNINPSNFFAIYNRTNKRQGFKFITHDSEHTLLTDAISPGIGLKENRVNINMNVSYFGKFHPQWLHKQLSGNSEYRAKFADRVYRHFFNNGVFIIDSCIARFKSTADKLDLAVIAESARWGDQGSFPARNKMDDWLPAINRVIFDYMPYRSGIVLNQLKDAKLYPEINPPVFRNNETEITDNFLISEENIMLSLENQNSTGIIYYTVNGEDPRATGGNISTSAINGGNSETVTVSSDNHIMARVKSGETWSALHELVFKNSDLFGNLKVTELHYHPLDQGEVNDKELEFIELKNTGSSELDLTGLSFTNGIEFIFPEGTSLAPDAFVIIASNAFEFNALYGFEADFQYSGSLSNGGEKIELKTGEGEIVITFTFSDENPWPEEADGEGYSLVSYQKNPTGNPDLADYWTISKNINGSPGLDDEISLTEISEKLAGHPTDFLIYPNPTSSAIYMDFNLNRNENTEICLFDLNGRLLQIMLNENLPAGNHSKFFKLDKYQLNPGIYLVTFRTANNSFARKLIYK
ncbi:MAG: CotH kinase family protein [Draconibacterium sp.]